MKPSNDENNMMKFQRCSHSAAFLDVDGAGRIGTIHTYLGTGDLPWLESFYLVALEAWGLIAGPICPRGVGAD